MLQYGTIADRHEFIRRPHSLVMLHSRSTTKKSAAVSSMLAATAVCAAAASPYSSSAASSPSHPLTSSCSAHPPAKINNNIRCDNTSYDGVPSSCINQAAELLSLRIPRGGSSTEKDTSSLSKAKESKARKKKRGTHSSTTDSSSNNNNKQRSSKASSSSSSSENVSSNEKEADSSSSSSRQQQQGTTESSSTTLPPAAQSILSQTCHYDVLGITKSATQSEIQKAYRRRAVLTHPDKTKGDRSAFDKVSEAYDVLSCENKRAVYDRFGMDGLKDGNMDDYSGGGGGGGFNDVFRDFFGMSSGMGFGMQFNQGGGGGSRSSFTSSSSSSTFGPRNRDLRYQLEVSLEDLYKGTTKHVAIQQPNPLRPHFPLRKEVEVTLTRGMHSGQSVRLSGVVDSIPDAAPADVVFLINQRRHPVYTRRGSDLAMEIRITLAEAIVGFKKKIVCLDGQEIVIGNPYEKINVLKEELVDAPSLPDLIDLDKDSSSSNNNNNSTNATSPDDATAMKEFPVQQIVKTTTISYHLPSKIIQTGDVHVLKGKGMPTRRIGGHDYGDMYVQYIVDLPGGTSSSSPSSMTSSTKTTLNTKNLSAQERVELARLLSKLEGKEDPTTDVIKVWEGGANNDTDVNGEGKKSFVHRLSVSSASEFGRSSSSNDDADHDEHLHEDDEEEQHHRGMNNFFHRAFHGGRSQHSSGFSGPFGFGGATTSGGGFRYYSSSSGGGSRGGPVYGDEDGHNDVQCQQM